VEAEIRRRCQRVSARVAEARVVGIGRSTPAAGGHGAKVWHDDGQNATLGGVTGSPDPRWSNDDLHTLRRVPGSAFEVVETRSLRP
jgi:hypothetical protein